MVIGGGFIGSEIAAALATIKKKVTLVIQEDGIGATIFPPELVKFITDYYRERGIHTKTRDCVVDVRKDGASKIVTTANGSQFRSDAVIAGIGTIPNSTLAAEAGLVVDDEVMVDASLRTSRPDIFAARDVASFYRPGLREWIRAEHADNANNIGRLAGRSMTGEDVEYRRLPFYRSDLFDLRYEAVGWLGGRLKTTVALEEPFRRGVIHYYLEDGRVCGALLWDTPERADVARELVAGRRRFELNLIRGGLRNRAAFWHHLRPQRAGGRGDAAASRGTTRAIRRLGGGVVMDVSL